MIVPWLIPPWPDWLKFINTDVLLWDLLLAVKIFVHLTCSSGSLLRCVLVTCCFLVAIYAGGGVEGYDVVGLQIKWKYFQRNCCDISLSVWVLQPMSSASILRILRLYFVIYFWKCWLSKSINYLENLPFPTSRARRVPGQCHIALSCQEEIPVTRAIRNISVTCINTTRRLHLPLIWVAFEIHLLQWIFTWLDFYCMAKEQNHIWWQTQVICNNTQRLFTAEEVRTPLGTHSARFFF